MKRLELEDFESHVGTVFVFSQTQEVPSMLATAGNTAAVRKVELREDLILTKAEAFKLDPRDMRSEDTTGEIAKAPFSLFFEGEHEPYLPQGMYNVKHPGFSEALDIFITCLGPAESKNGYQYEAVYG